MDLRLLWNAAMKHWALVLIGLLIGLGLAVGSLYSFSLADGRVAMAARDSGTYESRVEVLISDNQFGIGRTNPPELGADTFARTLQLAPSYARIMASDVVVKSTRDDVGGSPVDVTAEPVDQSPIVRVTVVGKDRATVRRTAEGIVGSFKSYLETTQDDFDVPKSDRINVRALSTPTLTTVSQRSWERGLLAMLLPLAAALGLAYSIEASSKRKESEQW